MTPSDFAAGLHKLSASENYRDEAIRNLKPWLEDARYAGFRPQIESLARRGQWNLLLDSFYRVMPFGTSGRRGPVGVGPNRINHGTVISSVQGHVNYLRKRFPNLHLRVVVAYDVRVFRDLRGLYDATLPNPLMGMSSRDFARLACGVYAANGVEVFTVPGEDGFFLATPELSFAIRRLKAHGGLNVSASHNHPDDNGAKFYMASGGQPVPPEDEVLADEVEAVQASHEQSFEDALRAGSVQWWDGSMHEAYLQMNLARSIDPQARGARIVYTPLHGTGLFTVGELLPRAGFDVQLVQRQAATDGAFPEIKFRVPNPEVPESMELVTETARALGADVGMATDPDADRLGAVAPAGKEWLFLTGNQLGVLLAAYILETKKEQGTLPPNGFVIKTAVTTELLTRIAKAHGVQMLGDLLVGFKYVGAALDGIEKDGRFRDLHGALADFLFAAEESNGFLVSPEVRDKDAAGAALLLGELCARLRAKGEQLGGYLTEVYRRYGYAGSAGYSLVAEGIAGTELLGRMMAALRAQAPSVVDGNKLQSSADYWDEGRFGKIVSGTDRSSRNFVQLRYERDLVIAVRPSGTEPKIKIYVERLFDPQPGWRGDGFAAAQRQMDESTRAVVLDVVAQLLKMVDIELPVPALLLSSLVSLDCRIDFARKFLPELEARLATGAADAAALTAWADTRLTAYGTDPRFLVNAGVAEYLRTAALSAEKIKLAKEVFALS